MILDTTLMINKVYYPQTKISDDAKCTCNDYQYNGSLQLLNGFDTTVCFLSSATDNDTITFTYNRSLELGPCDDYFFHKKNIKILSSTFALVDLSSNTLTIKKK